eukprot:scaffold15846_cov139-Skeletonema_marinoi.AAC.1
MHQWFTRRSLTVGTKRKRTQKGKPHVAHNDNQHGLYHTEKPYNMVIKAGEGARQQGRRVGDHPQDSAIHWTGPNISTDRILYCTEKTNGQLCEA